MVSPAKQTVVYAYPSSRTNRIPDSAASSADLLSVAGAVFETEKWLHDGTRTTELTIPLYSLHAYNRKRLENTLSDALQFVLAETVRVFFDVRGGQPKPLRHPHELPQISDVCLFSGGTDSFSGILAAKRDISDVEGVFCAHSDQARIIKIVDALQRDVFSTANIRVRKVSVPTVGIHGYAQLRGFLYCVAAAAWLYLLKARTLIVTECGPTMYQPLFSPLDSVTMTTHPVVLHYARTTIETMLGRAIALVTPFEDLTKAEVIALCPRTDYIKYTHSCISQRFGAHDGTCYGCVVRRLAATAAGVEDVTYARDPIADDNANGGNLMSLLVYCHDLLVRPDKMEQFEVEKIRRYAKHDLFHRFALDQFAALHVTISRHRSVRAGIRRLFDNVVAVVGTHALEDRLHLLRHFTPQINWKRTPPS